MRILYFFKVCCLLLSISDFCFAGIMAESSRVVFSEGMTQTSFMIANTNKYPIIVQTWIDNGDVNNTPEKTIAPFVVIPAVFKMNPKETKGLRIIFKNQPLPADRESLFWLNIYEIPPKNKSVADNHMAELLVAMNTQMKIFYRPKALIKDNQIVDILNRLQFSLTKGKGDLILTGTNPTGYYASFSNLKLLIGGNEYKPELKLDMMVSPKSSEKFTFKQIPNVNKQLIDLDFMLIDDYGNSQLGQRKDLQLMHDQSSIQENKALLGS